MAARARRNNLSRSREETSADREGLFRGDFWFTPVLYQPRPGLTSLDCNNQDARNRWYARSKAKNIRSRFRRSLFILGRRTSARGRTGAGIRAAAGQYAGLGLLVFHGWHDDARGIDGGPGGDETRGHR